MVFIIDGPVSASGYNWYRVAPASFGNGGDRGEFRYWGDPGPVGWVASADHDGTPWIEGAEVDCPAMADDGLSIIELLGPLAALSCYGDAPLRLRAIASNPGFSDAFGDGATPDPMYPTAYWSAPDYWAAVASTEAGTFGTVLDPVRFPNGERDIPQATDVDIVGHFDDDAAATCAAGRRPEEPETAAITLTCRTTFVVTDLIPFTGIDPG